MKLDDPGRRRFLHASSALAVGTAVLPARTVFAADPVVRLEWQQFKTTKWYSPFLSAIARMRANRDQADWNSWQYWVNVHINNCPHDISYFLAWHRGYLARIEIQLRNLMGMSDFAFPYWDYYRYARIPAEFTDPATGNPLYISGRQSTSVLNALTLAPFASNVTNFPRGMSNAYEPSCEMRPHNPVHNLIGGVMASMSSPNDPIFYLHHANIDRLWRAWVLAGAGRWMPPRTDAYWSGLFNYAGWLTMPRSYTYDTLSVLNYDYSDRTMPTSIPLAQADRPRIIRVQATPTTPTLPPFVNLPVTAAGPTGAETHSLGGRRNVALDERSASVELPVSAAHAAALESVAAGVSATISGSSLQFKSAHIVLKGLKLTPAGARGGYFYDVYLNLPLSGDFVNPKEQYLIGTLGPFEIDAAMHHGKARDIDITSNLAGLSAQQLSQLTVSFVRVNGDTPPAAGPTIGIDEVRTELSVD